MLRKTNHPTEFWFTAFNIFTRLAITWLTLPINSIAVERSFRMYSDVLCQVHRKIKNKNQQFAISECGKTLNTFIFVLYYCL